MLDVRNTLVSIRETLAVADRPLVITDFLQNPNELITWGDLEFCLNRPNFYDIEIIDKRINKTIVLPSSKKHWVLRETFDHRLIVDLFNQGNSAVVLNYGSHNYETNNFVKTFEEVFDVASELHVYSSLEGATSFSVHEDYPCNFIIQVEGKTKWKIYRNRSTMLVRPREERDPVPEELELELETVLVPGQCLYIPARAYHCAEIIEKRLSVSVPCWPRHDLQNLQDRNFYKLNL